jgi:hypothetical protein
MLPTTQKDHPQRRKQNAVAQRSAHAIKSRGLQPSQTERTQKESTTAERRTKGSRIKIKRIKLGRRKRIDRVRTSQSQNVDES